MSAPVIKLDSKCVKVSEFFQDSYVVPQFQRGYAWKHAQVEQFLGDIYEFLEEQNSSPIYLLGQVIIAPGRELEQGQEVYELVDGQQRATTLLLFLIALYKRFSKIQNWHQSAALRHHHHNLENMIIYTNQTTATINEMNLRIKVAGDGSKLVNAILEKDDDADNFPGVDITNWTRANILDAYKTIVNFLDIKYPDINVIPDLYVRVVTKLMLVRLELPTTELAVHVFDRINNRGLSLNSADLLKNIIFMRVKDQNVHERISIEWQMASEQLYKCSSGRLKHMEYLLRAIIVKELGDPISNTGMLQVWNERLVIDNQKALEYAASLPKQAEYLYNLDRGFIPISKDRSAPDKNINYGTRYFETVQHFPILLAGSQLEKKPFLYISQIIEDRTIISLLAKERPQDFERLVPKWSFAVGKLQSNASIEEIWHISNFAFLEIDRLLEVVKANFKALRYANKSDRTRIRYILARINLRTMKNISDTEVLPELNSLFRTSQSSKGQVSLGYDIEHIRPKSIYGGNPITDSIGNLVLAHPKDQRGAGDLEPFEDRKKAVYSSSKMLLTKSLCDYGEVMNSLNMDERKEMRKIHEDAPASLYNWDDSAIQRRTEMYWKLFLSDLAIPVK